MLIDVDSLDSVRQLTRDLRKTAKQLSTQEARYLVGTYYRVQTFRMMTSNQLRTLSQQYGSSPVIDWQVEQMQTLETQIKSALNAWTDGSELGRWAKSITGIGPVIAAGLLAHIDITRAPTVGHIWRYAGLDPTVSWKKGQKRPWNAELKRLCWLIGESFVKQSSRAGDVYGKIYKERKELEQANNEAGKYQEQAEQKLASQRISPETEAYRWYSVGKLPPAHLNARAKRYAVKLFLAHYHEVAYRLHYGQDPPLPYAIAILGHAHKISAPNQTAIEDEP